MPYFKALNSSLHYLSNADISNGGEKYLPEGAIAITEAEAITIQAPTFSQIQLDKINSLIVARDASIIADVMINGVVYPADDRFKTYVSRILNQTGRGKPLPAGDLIRAKDRSKPTVTAALLSQIEDAITAQEAAAWSKFNGLVDQVLAATDAATVEAIVW